MKRCMNCMSEMPEHIDVCPICGYHKETSGEKTVYLRPGTVIANRYMVGTVLGHGGFGITYIGFDKVLNRKVAVKEYFPGSFVTRVPGNNTISVYSGPG